jgi:hypothetical protein
VADGDLMNVCVLAVAHEEARFVDILGGAVEGAPGHGGCVRRQSGMTQRERERER